jgi:hypothetical protein
MLPHLLGGAPRLFARLLGLLTRAVLLRPGTGDGANCENHDSSVSHRAHLCKSFATPEPAFARCAKKPAGKGDPAGASDSEKQCSQRILSNCIYWFIAIAMI